MNPASPRQPLSRQRIHQAGLDLADVSGLGAVTMRQVAQGLGVEAMSLYKHVANKEDLLDGMVELVVAEMGVPSPDADWQMALWERAHTVRQILNRHPWAATLIESRSTIGPMRLRHNDSLIGVLRRAGFSIELAFDSMIALTSYVYGFVILEEGSKVKGRPSEVDSIDRVISAQDYPHIVEMIRFAYAKKPDSADSNAELVKHSFANFEFGLRHLIDGIERSLPVR